MFINTELAGISVEPFRGDLDALERMAHHSWREEYGLSSFPNLYRPEFVRYLQRIAGDPRHFVAAYKDGEILAFLANIPRHFNYQGKIYRAILSCLLVSRREYARKGLASAVIREAVRINQKITRYDFALLYLESGHASTRLIEKFREEGQPLQFIKKMYVLGRILDLERVAYSEGLKGWEKALIKLWGADRLPRPMEDHQLEVEELKPENFNEVMSLLNSYSGRVELARVWQSVEELEKELICPDVSVTLAVKKDGRLAAVLNYLIHDHIGKKVERWAWLNHLHLANLSAEEKIWLINYLLRYLGGRGLIGVIEWTKGYYPQNFLFRCRFFPYPRSVALHSWVFNPELKFEKTKRIYEVQI